MIDQSEQRTMQVPGQGIVPRGRPVVDHKEYPKHMVHPQYQPGKPGPEVKSPHGFIYNMPGTPIRFPPVLVKDADQEAYHASLGYESIGKSDPAAFAKAVGHGTIPEAADAYVPQEYPKWINGKLVKSREEEDKLGGPMLGSAAGDIVETGLAPQMKEDETLSASQPVINTAAPTPYEDKTMDQLRIEDLEAKVDNLTGLLAQALKALEEKPVKIAKQAAPVKVPKKARKPIVRTEQQKRDHSAAIRAGLARRKQLTESVPAEQVDHAPVQ